MGGRIVGRIPSRRAAEFVPPAILAVVTILAALPFLTGRYAFFLDHVVGPSWDPFWPRFYGFRSPGYGGALPLYGVLAAVAEVASPSVAQKLYVVGTLAFVSAAGYRTLPGGPWARLYGALVLLANPFVYARVLAGQWTVVWGVAVLPIALASVVAVLERGSRRDVLRAVVALTLLGFNAHLLFAAAIPLGLLVVAWFVRTRDVRDLGRALVVALVAIPVNAYWLGPTLLTGGGRLDDISATDLVAFAPRVDAATALYTTASMHGFWRGGYRYATDLVPAVNALFVVVLFLAVYGALACYDDEHHGPVVIALTGTAVIAVLLGAGVSGPAAPLFRWLFEHVPFFAGMRDANKFVALLALAYAYLGALGLSALLETVRSRPGGGSAGTAASDRRAWLAAAVVVLALVAPVVYTFPMVTGYAGQVATGDYPAGWYEADRLLEAGPADEDVLFLPWHGYMDYDWLGGGRHRVVAPARNFFSNPVLQSHAAELVGVDAEPVGGRARLVDRLFGESTTASGGVGESLARANVGYVVVATDADWRRYDAVLSDASDVRLVLATDHVRVYRNERRADRAYTVPALDSADGRAPLGAAERSPVRYRLEGTDTSHTVFAPPAGAPNEGWRYGGDSVVGHYRGVHPAFASPPDGGEVRYGPFYAVYGPSYAISLIFLAIAPVVVWRIDRRDRTGFERRSERRP